MSAAPAAAGECRKGDVLVVAKLDRLARSLPDARDIVADLTRRGVKLNIGGSVHDPTDPIGRLLFNVSRSTIYRAFERAGGTDPSLQIKP